MDTAPSRYYREYTESNIRTMKAKKKMYSKMNSKHKNKLKENNRYLFLLNTNLTKIMEEKEYLENSLNT